MVEYGSLDLEAKPNKSGGGHMEYFPGLQTSFIFSNANDTSDEVDVLIHEFCHSLQGFLGGKQKVSFYIMPRIWILWNSINEYGIFSLSMDWKLL